MQCGHGGYALSRVLVFLCHFDQTNTMFSVSLLKLLVVKFQKFFLKVSIGCQAGCFTQQRKEVLNELKRQEEEKEDAGREIGDLCTEIDMRNC